ncbi:hypothetical protein DQ04_20611000 [Trypanosoma grayi]|uniref:hypothetical protein n=1 Tax=Trypanosoma grayi TaxID=71804 RepID=UPI0004F41B13|nr:hypothetical protein DQ04_20611000 [Trypanosoma grayi]KEG05547.1 hypothetical protein DQ04_20611000 [Trypanosoma grayi]
MYRAALRGSSRGSACFPNWASRRGSRSCSITAAAVCASVPPFYGMHCHTEWAENVFHASRGWRCEPFPLQQSLGDASCFFCTFSPDNPVWRSSARVDLESLWKSPPIYNEGFLGLRVGNKIFLLE